MSEIQYKIGIWDASSVVPNNQLYLIFALAKHDIWYMLLATWVIPIIIALEHVLTLQITYPKGLKIGGPRILRVSYQTVYGRLLSN